MSSSRVKANQQDYDAFISYSHRADHALAQALRTRLQTLGRKWNQARAMRVFLDESSLPATSDLNLSIADALHRSRWLVLLASPRAARSPHVNAELEEWLRAGGSVADGAQQVPDTLPLERLLIALTDGGPQWDPGDEDDQDFVPPTDDVMDAPGRSLPREVLEVLPPALRSRLASAPVPLFVDLSRLPYRVTTRGFRKALDAKLPNLSSPILDVSKEVFMADERARKRRTKLGVATAAVITTLGSTAGIVAYQEQGAATSQTRLALSRRLVIQAQELVSGQPGLARQLIAAAYDIAPTTEVLGSMVTAASLPGIFHVPEIAYVYSPPLAFLPGDKVVAVAGDGVSLRDTETGNSVGEIRTHQGETEALAVSRSGRLLVSGDGWGSDASTSSAGTVQLWNIQDPRHPELLATLPPFPLGITDVALSADDRALAASSIDGTSRIWDISDPLHPRLMVTSGDGLGQKPQTLRFSPNGRLLAASTDTGVVLWDVSEPGRVRRVMTLPQSSGLGLAFTSDGRTLASSGPGGSLRLWNVADPAKAVLLGQTREKPGRGDLLFSPDAHTLYVSSGGGDGIGRWDVSVPVRPAQLPSVSTPDSSALGSMALSRSGAILATGTSGGVVRLWPTGAPTYHASSPRPELVGAFQQFSPDHKMLATGVGFQPLRLWDSSTPGVLIPLGSVDDAEARGQYIAISSDRRQLAVNGPNNRVQLWDISRPEKPRPIAWLDNGVSVDSMRFADGGRKLLITGLAGNDIAENRGAVGIWNISDPAHPTFDKRLDEPTGDDFTSTSPGPGPSLLTTTTEHTHDLSCHVYFWALEGRQTKPVGAITDMGSPCLVEVSDAEGSDASVAVVAEHDALWDVRDPKAPRRVGVLNTGSTNATVSMNPKLHLAVTTSITSEVALWGISDPAEPVRLSGIPARSSGGASAVFEDDATLVVHYSDEKADDIYASYSLRFPLLREQLCAHVGPRMTQQQWAAYAGTAPFRRPC